MQDSPPRAIADLGAPHAWPWLGESLPDARRAFAHGVALAHLDPEVKLAHCDAYASRWGEAELARALRYAQRCAPLGPGMARLLRHLTAAEVRP